MQTLIIKPSEINALIKISSEFYLLNQLTNYTTGIFSDKYNAIQAFGSKYDFFYSDVDTINKVTNLSLLNLSTHPQFTYAIDKVLLSLKLYDIAGLNETTIFSNIQTSKQLLLTSLIQNIDFTEQIFDITGNQIFYLRMYATVL